MQRHKQGWLILSLALVQACGDEDLSPVPHVSDLIIENPNVGVGLATTIRGSLTYTDGDLDISDFFVKVTTPTSRSQTVGPSPATDVSGRRAGTLAFQFTLNTEHAGTYILEIWVVDAQENESNRVSGTVTAS